MSSLYEISKEYQELQLLEDSGDKDLAIAIRDTMQGIEGEFKEKGKSLAMVTLNLDGDIEAIQSQIDRLTARKRALTNRKEALKEFLRENMEACEITSITHPLFSISLRKGSKMVVIDSEKDIPDEYVITKVSVDPDKVEIAKALKAGKEVPGAHLGVGKSSIIIK